MSSKTRDAVGTCSRNVFERRRFAVPVSSARYMLHIRFGEQYRAPCSRDGPAVDHHTVRQPLRVGCFNLFFLSHDNFASPRVLAHNVHASLAVQRSCGSRSNNLPSNSRTTGDLVASSALYGRSESVAKGVGGEEQLVESDAESPRVDSRAERAAELERDLCEMSDGHVENASQEGRRRDGLLETRARPGSPRGRRRCSPAAPAPPPLPPNLP